MAFSPRARQNRSPRSPTARSRYARREAEQLRLARHVQEALLPPSRAAGPGVEVAARFLPSRAVGGDFCDYFLLGSRHLGLYLGDVQGKGLEGALYALLVSGLMRGTNKTGNEPAHLVGFLNRRLTLRALPGKFCALSYALFDLERRQVTLANAGLPFPVLLRGGRLTRLEVSGFPVGMFSPCDYDQAVVNLQPGDRLLFYTDGLPDSLETLRPRAGDGEKQLAALLAQHGDCSAAALADALTSQLQRGASAGKRRSSPRPRGDSRRPRRLLDDATFLVVHVL